MILQQLHVLRRFINHFQPNRLRASKMSTPAKEGPASPTTLEKRGSFNKYFSRVKTALKRSDSSSKRQSIQGKSKQPVGASTEPRYTTMKQ